jgi:hypothetical protein
LPCRVRRSCTQDLKVMTAKRYLRHLGVREFENYIGFRADEAKRVLASKHPFKKVHDMFPLYEMGITKHDVNEYWKTKPYTLEIPNILGNCDLCFLKGKNVLINIMAQFPELAEKWIADEERTGFTFIKDISYKQLLEIAQGQKKLFDLNELQPAYNCSCTT